MSQARPNADQARRLFSTSARSRQRWWWKFGGAGVCLGAWAAVAVVASERPQWLVSGPSRRRITVARLRRKRPFAEA